MVSDYNSPDRLLTNDASEPDETALSSLVVKANIAIHLWVLTNIAIVLTAAAFSAEYCSMRV